MQTGSARWGFIRLLLATAMACGATYACAAENLILSQDDVLEFKAGMYQQSGTITLKDRARLVIENATLVLTAESGSPAIYLEDQAKLVARDGVIFSDSCFPVEFRDASTGQINGLRVSDTAQIAFLEGSDGQISHLQGGLIEVCGEATVTIEDSQFQFLPLCARSSSPPEISVLRSTIETVGIWLDMHDMLADISGLKPGYTSTHWDLADTGTFVGVFPHLTLEDTYVGGWHFQVSESIMGLHIADSHLQSITVEFGARNTSAAGGFHPGYAADFSVGGLEVSNSTVDEWGLYVWGASPLVFEVVDSEIADLSLRNTHPSTRVDVLDSTVGRLTAQGFEGVLGLQGSALESIMGFADCSMALVGSVRVGEVEVEYWENAHVEREYEAVVSTHDGDPLVGAKIRLVSSQGGEAIHATTDSTGTATARIPFDDDTYESSWRVLVPDISGRSIGSLYLLASTPLALRVRE